LQGSNEQKGKSRTSEGFGEGSFATDSASTGGSDSEAEHALAKFRKTPAVDKPHTITRPPDEEPPPVLQPEVYSLFSCRFSIKKILLIIFQHLIHKCLRMPRKYHYCDELVPSNHTIFFVLRKCPLSVLSVMHEMTESLVVAPLSVERLYIIHIFKKRFGKIRRCRIVMFGLIYQPLTFLQ